MKTFARTLVLACLDLVLIQVAGLAAIGLRFEFAWPARYLMLFETVFPILAGLRLCIYCAFGLYSRVWRYASVPEMRAIMMAGTAASALDSVFLHVALASKGFPRSATLLMWVFNLALAGGLRLGLRMRQELQEGRLKPRERTARVLLVGAGQAGWMIVKELKAHPELGLSPVGFLDDDPAKLGCTVAGVRVLGRIRDLPRVVRRRSVDEVVVSMPSAPGQTVRQVVDLAQSVGVPVRTVPGFYEILDGTVSLSRVRPVDISDLLKREEVKIEPVRAAEYLEGARVLVTGAGGSIGSELCRQIARTRPAQLLLMGHGEHSIHEILCELRYKFKYLNVVPVIADVRDAVRVDAMFAQFKPEVVFHAAAHKHVYLMQLNPEEAFTTNVLGTWIVARAADAHGVRRFVLISTDKAVNPTSVMGASKQAAENVVRLFNQVSATRFVAVRFGNVLGSRGSVIPLFKQQIAWGGPVTVTDPRMKRYFMTVPEAAQLVLEAGALGNGGELFVLDMGKPVSILEMARQLIRLSGFEPDRDIKIEFSGARPGEKLEERLTADGELLVPTEHPRILRVEAVGAGAAGAGGLGGLMPEEESVQQLLEGYRRAAAAKDGPGREFAEWIAAFATAAAAAASGAAEAAAGASNCLGSDDTTS